MPAAVSHDHLASSTPHLPTVVSVVAATAAALVAVFHAARITRRVEGSRHPAVPVLSRPGSRWAMFAPLEAGHAAIAGGMAVMFVSPSGWGSSDWFALTFLVLAVVFLALILASPACCQPGPWSCCSMLVVEALAMASMARAGRWPVGDLTDLDDLSGWFAVIFAASAAVAIAGPVLRRTVSAWSGAPPSLTPAASRLVMATGMLLMLL